MRVLVQWTRRNPRDWEEIDSADWPTTPSRSVPASGQLGGQDNAAGWISALNVQGVIFEGYDHYAVEDVSGGCQVTVWNDDPDDPRPHPWRAARWTFLEPAPDLRYNGAVNTRQSVEFWHETEVPGAASGGLHRTHNPESFVAPAKARHGVWLSDDKHDEHRRTRTPRGWQEWIR